MEQGYIRRAPSLHCFDRGKPLRHHKLEQLYKPKKAGQHRQHPCSFHGGMAVIGKKMAVILFHRKSYIFTDFSCPCLLIQGRIATYLLSWWPKWHQGQKWSDGIILLMVQKPPTTTWDVLKKPGNNEILLMAEILYLTIYRVYTSQVVQYFSHQQ